MSPQIVYSTYIDSIEMLVNHINQVFNVQVTIHDVCGFSHVDEKLQRIIRDLLDHRSPLCKYAKSHTHSMKMCVLNKYFANIKAGKPAIISGENRASCGYFCGTCYLGIREYVFPIFYEHKYLGSIYIGSFTENMQTSLERLTKQAVKYGLDPQKTYSLYKASVIEANSLSVMDFDKLLELAHILRDQIILVYLYYKYKDFLTQRFTVSSDTPAEIGMYNDFIIDRAIEYIKSNYTLDISLKEIARHCFCSSYYLSRIFKKKKSESLIAILNDFRIQVAKQHLNNTNMTVTEIAANVGFNSQTYFSYVFHRITNMSPVEYRAKHR